MAHKHNIWFNESNKIYQLSKFPEIDTDSVIKAKKLSEHWVLIASFEADTLENIVSGFQSISKAHQDIDLVI